MKLRVHPSSRECSCAPFIIPTQRTNLTSIVWTYHYSLLWTFPQYCVDAQLLVTPNLRPQRGTLRIPLHRLKEIQDMDLGSLLNSLRGPSHPEFVSFVSHPNGTTQPTGAGSGLLGAGRPSVSGEGLGTPAQLHCVWQLCSCCRFPALVST